MTWAEMTLMERASVVALATVFWGVLLGLWGSALIVSFVPAFSSSHNFARILSLFWGLLFLLGFLGCALDNGADGGQKGACVLIPQMAISLACWGHVVWALVV